MSTSFVGYGTSTGRAYPSSGLIVDGKTLESFSGGVQMNTNGGTNSRYSESELIYIPFYNGFNLYASANKVTSANYATSSITAYYYKFNVPT